MKKLFVARNNDLGGDMTVISHSKFVETKFGLKDEYTTFLSDSDSEVLSNGKRINIPIIARLPNAIADHLGIEKGKQYVFNLSELPEDVFDRCKVYVNVLNESGGKSKISCVTADIVATIFNTSMEEAQSLVERYSNVTTADNIKVLGLSDFIRLNRDKEI